MRYLIDCEREFPYAEAVTEEEFEEKYSEFYSGIPTLIFKEKIRHCKADIFEKFVHGSISVPDTSVSERSGRFFMDEKRVIFISETDWTDDLLKKIFSVKAMKMETTAQVFFAFMDELIRNEGDRIDDFEQSLNEKEEEILAGINTIPEGFEHYMQRLRKNLLNVNRYYEQLGDMLQTLSDSPSDVIDDEARRLYEFLSARADRLSADILKLREFSTQLYDIYQSGINLKQNKVMQFLTVITTIFMPLTLITGWYGMNFKYMPETGWKYGYLGVIGFSALLFIVEYIIFKRKKWM